MQKLDGRIIKYDAEKKFGFIQTKNNKDIFFHIREFRPRREPVVGEQIVFELGEDNQGRICAVNIQELSFVIQKEQERQIKIQRRQAYEAHQERQEQKHGVLNAVCIFSLVYLILIAIAVLFFNISKIILVWYVIISIVSFIVYYLDKVAAENDERRTPEKTLHLIDVLGGWVGASFAHKFLNHKATKAEFRAVFYITIIANIIGLIAIDYLL